MRTVRRGRKSVINRDIYQGDYLNKTENTSSELRTTRYSNYTRVKKTNDPDSRGRKQADRRRGRRNKRYRNRDMKQPGSK
jgi:hypothetical protein